MYICMKALDARGEYLVDLMVDGYGGQYVGPRNDGSHLFRTWDKPGELLNVWQERFAVIEPDWPKHATVEICD